MSIDSTAADRRSPPVRDTIEPSRTTVRFESKVLLGAMTVRGTFAVIDGVIVVAEDPARSSVQVTMDPGELRQRQQPLRPGHHGKELPRRRRRIRP